MMSCRHRNVVPLYYRFSLFLKVRENLISLGNYYLSLKIIVADRNKEIKIPSTSVSSSAVCCEGSLHLKGPRYLTEWIPTNGLRPNARLSLTRMLIGGEYKSSTGRFL